MNLGKNIMMIVSLMVAVIIALAVLVPVIQDTSASEDTITNSGYLRMKHTDATDETVYTIEWDKSVSPNIITVNDVDVPIKNIPNNYISFNVVFNSNWLIRATSNDGTTSISTLQYYTTSGGVTSINNTMSLVCDSGSFTMSHDSSSKSGTYTDLYIPDKDGPYIMKSRDSPAYMLADSEFIGYGLTPMISPVNQSTISPGLGLLVNGTIEDGVTITPWRGVSSYNSSYSDETIVSSESKTWVGVYDLDKITFTATLTSTSDETVTEGTAVTYSYFLVPYEITAERIVHVTPIEASLLGIIPLLVVIGIVIGAVWFIRQKN